jgi:hypothetical protein
MSCSYLSDETMLSKLLIDISSHSLQHSSQVREVLR